MTVIRSQQGPSVNRQVNTYSTIVTSCGKYKGKMQNIVDDRVKNVIFLINIQ